MPLKQTIALCVVLAKETINTAWQDHVWRPVDVILDPLEGVHGRIVAEGEGWVRYFADAEPLELHRREVEAYSYNLAGREPTIWVVLSENDEDQQLLPFDVHLVTASPYEAQDYLDPGESVVEAIPMPASLIDIINEFIAGQPAPEKFKKRKRVEVDFVEHKFGQEPLVDIREKIGRSGQSGKRRLH